MHYKCLNCGARNVQNMKCVVCGGESFIAKYIIRDVLGHTIDKDADKDENIKTKE